MRALATLFGFVLVPTSAANKLASGADAKAIIEEQDREIGLASGRPRGVIKSMMRSRT